MSDLEVQTLNKKRKRPDERNEQEDNEKKEEEKQKQQNKKKKFEELDKINKLLKEIEDKMLTEIIEYLKNGVVPKNNNPTSYLDCYTNVCTIVDKKDYNLLYLIEYHNKVIYDFVKFCFQFVNGKSNIELIDSFIEYTEKINLLIYWMKRIFIYIDKKPRIDNKETLCMHAMKIYKNHFFNNIQNDIYQGLNKLIKDDRDGKIEQRSKIKFILKMVDTLDFGNPQIIKENNKISWISEKNNTINNNKKEYKNNWFENYFVKDTIIYAETKAKKEIQNMSAPEYINSQLKYLEEEEMRKIEYINPIYHLRINTINYLYLIGEKANELGKMDTDIPHMLASKKYDDLKNVYNFYKLMNFFQDYSYKQIISAFSDYIISKGNEIYNSKEITKDPKQFIPALISLKKEMDKIIEHCFENQKIFKDAAFKAFKRFMKKALYAKQLSNYIDFCMKIGFKGKSADDINKSLDEIIDLYQYLDSKIIFHIEADNKMSNRLIKNISISIYNEKQFISKLSQVSGVNNINKMTQMMKDIEINKKLIEEYKTSRSLGMPNEIKFNIQVITQSAWDINKNMIEKVEIPKFLQSCLQDFEQFYLKKYEQRKLIWCLGLSKIEIQYLCFQNKNISLSTLPQFLTLLQLEKYNKLTLGKISELIRYNIKNLLTEISGLVYNPNFNPYGKKDKGLILGTFNENTKEFKDTDEIYFNNNFICPRQKFQTLPLIYKKSIEEVDQIEIENEKIIKNYQNNILKSTITRIMKSKNGKKISHIWLIEETSKQIDLFKAQPQQIKENIEKLIELDIIKRDDKDRTCYEYIS